MSKRVTFGQTLGSVLQLLGNPNKEFYRADCLVLNYLELGIDLVFDSTSSSLTKISLNSNNPKMPDFCFSERCFFEMKISKKSLIEGQDSG